MKVTIFSLILFLLLFLGCDDSNVNPNTNFENGLKLHLDKTIFNINEPIISTLSNQTNSPAFLYHCGFKFTPDIERKENNSWIYYYSPVCPAVYLSGVTEFEAFKETKEINFINKPGIYRLKLSYSFCNINNLDKSLYSEEFTIEYNK